MNKRFTVIFVLVNLAIAVTGCGLLGITQRPATPVPTPTPTPRPTIPPEQIYDLDELDNLVLRSGDEFTVRITQEYVAQNVGDLAQSYEGVTFSGSQVTLEQDIIRFKAKVTIQEVDATITVTLEGTPAIYNGMTYLQIRDLRVGDDDNRSLGDILVEKTLEEALDDLSTEQGIHIALEEAKELDTIELQDVRVLEGEMLLSCQMR